MKKLRRSILVVATLFSIAWLWLLVLTLRSRPSLQHCSRCFCNSNNYNAGSFEVKSENFFEDSSIGMDDPLLIDHIHMYYLEHPLPVPYNLENPLDDPDKAEGHNLIVLQLLGNKTQGIFVEAGAYDGEYLSTTLMLERDYGWTGLLVEPDATAFAKLRTKNRKAWRAGVCLSPSERPQKIKFLQNHKHSVLSKMAENKGKIWNWWYQYTTTTVVPCFPLYSLLLSLNMTQIDYFSLDVEGAELDVLKTIPWDAVTIRVLSVEYNMIRLIPGADRQLRRLLRSKGYRLVTELKEGNARDYIFAHSSVLEATKPTVHPSSTSATLRFRTLMSSTKVQQR